MKTSLPALGAGDHVCLPYATFDESCDVMADYLRDGVRRGERSVFWGNPAHREAIEAGLTKRGLPLSHMRNESSFLFMTSTEIDRGTYKHDSHEAILSQAVRNARAAGFSGLRFIMEPNEAEDKDTDHLFRRESALAASLSEAHASALCLYNRQDLTTKTLPLILGYHTLALVEGKLCRNPFVHLSNGKNHNEQSPTDWMMHTILNNEEVRERIDEQYAILIHEAARLGKSDEHHCHHIETLTRALESRDRLLVTIARWLSRPLPSLCAHLESFNQDERMHSVRNLLEPCGDYLAGILRLSNGLDEIASFLQMQIALRPEPLDIVKVAHKAIADVLKEGRAAELKVQMNGVPTLEGSWDRLRVSRLFQSLIRTARDQGYGSKVQLSLVDLKSIARIQVEFHHPNIESAPTGSLLRDSTNHAERPADESAYERLGVTLWPSRELVRAMGGSFGISTWADARVVFTIDLPKSIPATRVTPLPSLREAGLF
jgi:hypothetical protein